MHARRERRARRDRDRRPAREERFPQRRRAPPPPAALLRVRSRGRRRSRAGGEPPPAGRIARPATSSSNRMPRRAREAQAIRPAQGRRGREPRRLSPPLAPGSEGAEVSSPARCLALRGAGRNRAAGGRSARVGPARRSGDALFRRSHTRCDRGFRRETERAPTDRSWVEARPPRSLPEPLPASLAEVPMPSGRRRSLPRGRSTRDRAGPGRPAFPPAPRAQAPVERATTGPRRRSSWARRRASLRDAVSRTICWVRSRLPPVVDPQPCVGRAADRRLSHFHVARGRAAHPFVPVDVRPAELFRQKRALELEPVAPVGFRPGEDRHDRRSRLQVKERERRSRGRRPPEERDEHGFPPQNVLVDENGDRLVSRHCAKQLLCRLSLGDRTVPEPPSEARELLLEERVVERAGDRRDRLSQESRYERPDLPAPEVRGKEEDSFPARARGAKVLLSDDRDAGQQILTREPAGLEEVDERAREPLDRSTRDGSDLLRRLPGKGCGQVVQKNSPPRRKKRENESRGGPSRTAGGRRRQQGKPSSGEPEKSQLGPVAQGGPSALTRAARGLRRESVRARLV